MRLGSERTRGVWSHWRDMTMVGTVYCTKMTSSVGRASANTSQRGFMRLLLLNLRSAATHTHTPISLNRPGQQLPTPTVSALLATQPGSKPHGTAMLAMLFFPRWPVSLALKLDLSHKHLVFGL